jgi:hypothetical protein
MSPVRGPRVSSSEIHAIGSQHEAPPSAIVIELTRSQILHICREAGEPEAQTDLLDGPYDDVWHLGTLLNEVARNPMPRFSKSLVCGLYVLASLPDNGTPIGIAELAETLGLSSATLHRYLRTLIVAELAQRDAATRKYSLAPALVASPALAVEDE